MEAHVQQRLTATIKPKFNAYFEWTEPLSTSRSVPDPKGQPFYIYPDQTMISDLTFLWSIFDDVYEILGGPNRLAQSVYSDSYLQGHFRRIVEGHSPQHPDGEFWHFPAGLVPPQTIDDHLADILRTLRNGFVHSHWFYADLSALDYWKKVGWDTANSPSQFNLYGRRQKNYTIYIADGDPFRPDRFWSIPNLRILVTPVSVLRYHLHLFLNSVLNGTRKDVFGNLV